MQAEFSYYVGADWIPGFEKKKHLYVQSKLNTQFEEKTGEEVPEGQLIQIDIIKMLFDALSEKETVNHTADLFEIKFDKPFIGLKRSEDFLSPMLIMQFLMVVRDIVRRGLKKGYYRVEQNLYSRVKGKVLISKTIKHNTVKNRNLHTLCSFEEYGTNIIENRLLKKALTFARSYLSGMRELSSTSQLQQVFNYIQPAFKDVKEDVSLHEIKHIKFNAFYKDYQQAIQLAKLILKRFGYNLHATQTKDIIATPPFWVDMSKLFELYVLRLLKQKWGSKLKYHPRTYGNELDYLLVDGPDSVVVDAKYKPSYKSHNNHQDIRQVSGYARLKKVFQEIGLDEKMENPPVLRCLIIYPDQTKPGTASEVPSNPFETSIDEYVKMHKLGVKLPEIKNIDV